MIQMGRSGLAWFACGSSSHPRRLCHLITGGGDGAAAVAAAAVARGISKVDIGTREIGIVTLLSVYSWIC